MRAAQDWRSPLALSNDPPAATQDNDGPWHPHNAVRTGF